ncbi:2-C-methyl-D-erythritol 4-phosphate cytidylyltransferase [Jatrophihabitans sp.]|uniref:2-C-methyl-D-erythritol 4-phosphate cytidylyltransferase n=1 Tax=Jatrophihabitans sp. TaxID=1932789 RepID=UPI002EFF9C48
MIVAAGSGERLGAGMPKALVPLHGRPLLDWALDAFTSHPDIDSVVVVAPADALAAVRTSAGALATVVAGGASRQHSVDLGLAAVHDDVELVLVHDAARPLVEASVISAVVARLRQGDQAVIPVLPVTDTIKRVDSSGRVLGTVDRAELRAVQTPQGFSRAALTAAHRAAEQRSLTGVTDDAGLLEALGVAVRTVAGAEISFKITTPYDLELAHRIAPKPTQLAGQAELVRQAELAGQAELAEPAMLSDSGRPA